MNQQHFPCKGEESEITAISHTIAECFMSWIYQFGALNSSRIITDLQTREISFLEEIATL